MDKTTGSKVSFMSDQPELGRLGSLDIHTDGRRDGMYRCNLFSNIYCLIVTILAIQAQPEIGTKSCKLVG